MNMDEILQNKYSLYNAVRRRVGHVTITYNGKLYLWGGYMESPDDSYYYVEGIASPVFFHEPDKLWVYEPLLNIWHREICTGDIPHGLSGASSALIDNYLYVLGGFNNIFGYNKSVYRLDLYRKKWKLIETKGFSPLLCDKSVSWSHDSNVYIFGGFCSNTRSLPYDIKISLIQDEISDKAWVDQFAYLDTKNYTWVWPKCKGNKPSPRAAHAAAYLKNNAYIFGGRLLNERMNDCYCLNMINLEWSVIASEFSQSIPGRSWHTLNALPCDKLILYGGFDTERNVLNDAWIYDIKTKMWTEIKTSKLGKRLWHSGAVFPESNQIFYTGGIVTNILDRSIACVHAEEMVRIDFSVPTLLQLTVEDICKRLKKVNHPLKYLKNLPKVLLKIMQVRLDPFEVHGL